MSDIQLSSYAEAEQLTIIGNFEKIALLVQKYTFYQSLNIWLWVVVLLFDYSFAGELAFVLDIIDSSLFDMIFFILMFFTVLKN